MALDFPTSPSPNQVHTSGSRSWTWNNSVGAWYAVNAGVQGVQGIQGAQGIQGVQGITGLAFTIAKTYLSVAALTADTAPTSIAAGQFALINTTNVEDAENSRLYIWNGSSYIFVDDLSGSAGIQGITGAQGTVGAQGTQGIQGITGAQGTVGAQGIQGITGTQGAQGLQGTQGTQGIQGIQGITGIQGAIGSQGTLGTQGTQGIQGISGASILGLNNTFTGTNAFTTLSASAAVVAGTTTAGPHFFLTKASPTSAIEFVDGGVSGAVKLQAVDFPVTLNRNLELVGGTSVKIALGGTTIAEALSTGLAVTGTGSFSTTSSNALTLNRSSGGSADIRFQRGGVDKGYLADNSDGITIYDASAAARLAVTSAGAAVTGALSATGNTTIGAGGTAFFTVTNTTGTGGTTINAMGGPSTGNFKSADSVDTAATRWTFGRDNQTTGDFVFKLNGTQYMGLSSTGVAVTGTSPTVIQLTRGGTSGSQLMLGNTYAPTVGVMYSSAEVFLTSNAYQTTDSANAWAKGSGSYSSNAIMLGMSTNNTSYAFKITRSPANTASGTLSNFFTQTLLTVGENGNVGIGTASPSTTLDVNGNGRFIQNAAATTGAIILRQAAADAEGSFIQWVNNANTVEKGWLTVDTSSNMKFATVSTERMRINSSGNVGIGTTSPGASLQIGSGTGGGYFPSTSKLMFGANNSVITFLSASDSASVDGVIGSWNTAYNHQNAKIVFDKPTANTGQMLFFTQNGSGITERARIDNSGNFIFYNAAGNINAQFVANKGAGSANSGGFALGYVAVNYTPGSASSNIYWDGGTGYFTLSTSARKYKRNIVAVTDEQLDKALLLKPSYYQRNEYDYYEYGFIAEEVNEIGLDEFVTRVEGEISGLNYEKMVTLAIGLAQRQAKENAALVAQITALSQRLAVLESK